MKINPDAVVTIDYTLTDDEGTVIDQSSDGNFSYLHNGQNIIPGLEAALLDKQSGDQIKATIEPAQAYGEKDLGQIQRIPHDMFPNDVELQAGMQFQGEAPDGGLTLITITAIDGDEVVVDGNHPLAGLTLHFDVTVVDVREATGEEIEHGHVHGPEGHEHDDEA